MKIPRTSQAYWKLAEWLRVTAIGIAIVILVFFAVKGEAYVDLISPGEAMENVKEAVREAQEREREIRDGPFYDPDHPDNFPGMAEPQ